MTTTAPKAKNERKEGPVVRASGADGNRRIRVLTGALLILTPIAFNVFFTVLSVTFEYPNILRKPTGYVLRRFDAGGGLVVIWYGFMLTAVLFVPLAVLVHKALAREDTPYLAVATAFGVVAGVVQFLGLVRWPFLLPYLADTFLDPASSGATRESVAVVFQAFNQYAGVAVGEHLGYLFTGTWTALVALAMFGSPLLLGRWLGLLGIVSAAGVLVGTLEPVRFRPAADVVVVGYVLWSVWLALFGILLLLPGSIRQRAPLGISGLIRCYSFYRTKLIPRFLAVWGLVGYAVILGGSVVKGFNPAAFVPDSDKSAMNERDRDRELILSKA